MREGKKALQIFGYIFGAHVVFDLSEDGWIEIHVQQGDFSRARFAILNAFAPKSSEVRTNKYHSMARAYFPSVKKPFADPQLVHENCLAVLQQILGVGFDRIHHLLDHMVYPNREYTDVIYNIDIAGFSREEVRHVLLG